jgi:steroid delta-isomerase-like uncharacterized protein
MSVEQNIAVVRAIYDAFNTRDIDKVFSLLSPDLVLEDVTTGQAFRGPEGFMQWVQPFATASPETTANLTHIIASGEWVFTEHTGGGPHVAPLVTPAGEIPVTGRPLEIKFAEVFQVQDGKIILLRAYWVPAR